VPEAVVGRFGPAVESQCFARTISFVKPSPRQLKQRCPCGSGKAFKNCHGQEFLLPTTPRVARYAEQLPDPYLDPPGYTYATVAALDEHERPLSNLLGESGQYRVDFTLLQPGQAAEGVKGTGTTRRWEIQNDKIVGDSHLALTIPKDARPSPNTEAGVVVTVPVRRTDGSADDVEMVLKPNPDGRLSKVSVKLRAANFSEAERRAHFEAASYLSHLAFELDLPLRIAHTYVKEVKSGHARTGFVRQFAYKGMGNLPSLESAIKPDPFPALASVYREALNSDSPFYQLLCFCRVVQRLMKPLRPKWKSIIIEHDKRLLPRYEKTERFPKVGEEVERFPEAVLGEKFARVYAERLRPLRDGVAHVFLEDASDRASAERSTDDLAFANEVYSYVPVAHHMARTMLKNDFADTGLAIRALKLASG
jgi:SEC-C motif